MGDRTAKGKRRAKKKKKKERGGGEKRVRLVPRDKGGGREKGKELGKTRSYFLWAMSYRVGGTEHKWITMGVEKWFRKFGSASENGGHWRKIRG